MTGNQSEQQRYWLASGSNDPHVHVYDLSKVLGRSEVYNCSTQPDSHYIRYTAASVLRSTTLSTPEGHWLTCAW